MCTFFKEIIVSSICSWYYVKLIHNTLSNDLRCSKEISSNSTENYSVPGYGKLYIKFLYLIMWIKYYFPQWPLYVLSKTTVRTAGHHVNAMHWLDLAVMSPIFQQLVVLGTLTFYDYVMLACQRHCSYLTNYFTRASGLQIHSLICIETFISLIMQQICIHILVIAIIL